MNGPLTITDIMEEDFGCEGRPQEQEPMVTILVRDPDGHEQIFSMADRLAYARDLDLGDLVRPAQDGTLILIQKHRA